MLQNIKISKYQNIIYFILLFIFSCFSIFLMGRSGIKILSYASVLFFSLYLLKIYFNQFLYYYIIFIVLLSIIYAPQAIVYGKLNIGIVASLFETNLKESLEYISDISIRVYYFLVVYLFIIFHLLKLNKKTKLTKKYRKINILITVIVFLSIFQKPLTKIYKENVPYLEAFISVKYYPLRFIFEFLYYKNDYVKYQKELNESLSSEDSWNIINSKQLYKNYVLVIGESVRRDYMSLYGYPIETTPFLNKVNGKILSNYISPAPNTITSLKRMLFQHSKLEDFIYPNTLITLANKAGLDTYWLSNQGKIGQYDTLPSRVAIKAKYKFFTKLGNYNSNNKPDLELIPQFLASLDKPSDRSKLIVLHLMGSHGSFCKRVDNSYEIENIENIISEDISCYLSSIKQTDKLLEKIYKSLKNRKETFSIIYFSDHGLAHNNDSLKHNGEYKSGYSIPFIMMSSNDRKQTVFNTKKSGYNFLNHISNWLGIKTRNLSEKETLFNHIDNKIKVFNGNKVVDFEQLKEDPALIP